MNHKRLFSVAMLLAITVCGMAQALQLKLDNVSVKKAMAELKQKSGYSFVLEAGDVNLSKKVSVNATTLQQAIEQILSGQNTSYEIKGKNIIVSKTEADQTKETNSNKIRVTGVVLDESGEPIIGASVMLKNSSKGTITDANGNFSLDGVQAGQNILITYIGFLPENIKIASAKSLSVTLRENAQDLEEVIVVGYGAQRKADVTGATAHVSTQDLTAMPVKDALQGMQGKVAGVDIQNSQRPGEVGNIQVRGVRSLNADQGPLYVVDGMILQNGGIENINPQDIESIDVLKDAASTSVYGSRGANGVILVTTKHGKKGKVSVNYAGAMTVDWIDEITKFMTASEWLDYSRMAYYNAGTYQSSIGSDGKVIPVYEQDKNLYGEVSASWANIEKAWVNGTYDPSLVGSYDWVGQGKQTGITHEHNINFAGGADKFSGYGSFGYLNTRGTQPGQGYERYTLKVNFESQVLPFLKLSSVFNGAYGMQDYGYSYTKGVTGAGDYYGALQGMLPWTVPYDENGEYLMYPNGDSNILNPIDELKYNTNRRNTLNLTANVSAEVNFEPFTKALSGLTYRIQFGPEMKNYEVGTFNDQDGINGDGHNKASWTRQQYRSWVLDNIVQYNKKFADVHHLNVTLLQSANQYHSDSMVGSNSDLATNKELWYNLSSSTEYKLGSGLTEKSMISYMGRISYNYADRYMFTASVRRDGASQLAKGHKWATFPSASVAWRLDQESFMESTKDWLNALKFRVSYGVSGNSAISAYATKGAIQAMYQLWGDQNTSIGYMSSDNSSASPSKAANTQLGWERTAQLNMGIDFAFLHNRIYGNVDWYTTRSTDLLMVKSIPSINGYTSTYDNVGATKGHGVDLQLNVIPVKTRDFLWEIGLSWSCDRSYIDKLANGKTEDVSNLWFVGEPIGVYYDYVYDGVWKTDEVVTLADGTEANAATYGRKTGQIKVKDINGDGKIDADNDRQIIGKKRPDWSAGLNTSLKYKNLELSMFIYSRWGYTVTGGSASLSGRYMSRSIDYFVAGYNEDAEYYAPTGSNDTYASCQGYQDGSYIKVRNINLGYTFTKKQLNNTGISSLKLYAQFNNPFTIYRACDWMDCDQMNYSNSTKSFGTSTTTHSVAVGVNIGF